MAMKLVLNQLSERAQPVVQDSYPKVSDLTCCGETIVLRSIYFEIRSNKQMQGASPAAWKAAGRRLAYAQKVSDSVVKDGGNT